MNLLQSLAGVYDSQSSGLVQRGRMRMQCFCRCSIHI